MTQSIDSLITDLSAGERKPYTAMQELVEAGQAAVTPLVLALPTAKNDTVRDRIATTLARIGRPAVPALLKAYAGEFDPKIKAAMLDALGEIADPAVLPLFTSALQDSDAKVRRLADYGIRQIQAANPDIDVKTTPTHDIGQAKGVHPLSMSSYPGSPMVPERGRLRRVVSDFLRRWVFGFDTPEEMKQQIENPFARWIIRPLRKSLSSFLIAMLLVYAALCIWEGIAWSVQLSDTYGLRIIRYIVVAVLSLVSAFTLPFVIGFFLLYAAINVALLFIPIGVIHGFTLSPEGELQARQGQRIEVFLLSLIAIGFVLVSYGYDILMNDYPGMIISYLLVSPLRLLILGAGVVLLVARNLYYSVKAQQPIQQPLTW